MSQKGRCRGRWLCLRSTWGVHLQRRARSVNPDENDKKWHYYLQGFQVTLEEAMRTLGKLPDDLSSSSTPPLAHLSPAAPACSRGRASSFLYLLRLLHTHTPSFFFIIFHYSTDLCLGLSVFCPVFVEVPQSTVFSLSRCTPTLCTSCLPAFPCISGGCGYQPHRRAVDGSSHSTCVPLTSS